MTEYSTPLESKRIFLESIAQNALLPSLPRNFARCAKLVHLHGNAAPSIPVNWRWAESISALKALEATMVNCLLMDKFEMEPIDVSINTYVMNSEKPALPPLTVFSDHASLFIFSPHLAKISGDGEQRVSPDTCLPLCEQQEQTPKESLYRLMATNIYKTRDGRCYHIHGVFWLSPGYPQDIQ